MTAVLLPLIVAFGELAQVQSEPSAISIEFDAPSGCSSVEAFYEGIRSRTARVKQAHAGEIATLVRIRLFRVGTKIKGELRLSDLEGEKETRKVDGATCEEVVEALALTVTLALDPGALFAVRPLESPPPSNPSAAPGPSEPLTPARLPTPHVEAGAQWVTATPIRPGVSFGAAAIARYLSNASPIGRFSIGFSLTYVRNDLLLAPEHGKFDLILGGFEFCPWRSPAKPSIEVGLCALAVGGRLNAEGVKLDHPASTARSWWAAGLSALGSAKIAGGLRLALTLSGTLPLIRREFTENSGVQAVSSSPWAVLQSGIGFDYRF